MSLTKAKLKKFAKIHKNYSARYVELSGCEPDNGNMEVIGLADSKIHGLCREGLIEGYRMASITVEGVFFYEHY